MNKKRLLSYLLTGTMVLTLAPSVSGATTFPDMPNNWSTNALQNAVDNGLITGVPERGKLYIKPNNTLKRAEMASIINKAFGSSVKASMTGITDVKSSDWFYDHMAMAIQMESFAKAAQMRPNDNITREEAFTVLAKVFKLPEATSYNALSPFTDADRVSDYAKSRIAALLEKGYISGSGNRLNPKNNITRAEFATVMDNIIKQYVNTPGTATQTVSGNVMVNVPNVTLRNVTVSGDLILADGIGKGNVTLDGVKVNGRLVVRGGGPNSIEITGSSTVREMLVANLNNQVRIYAGSGAKISTLDASGQVILDGSFPDVSITGEDAKIDIYGTVDYLNVEAPANIFVDKNATLKTTDIQKIAGGTILTGDGLVERVNLKADGVQINTNKTRITIASGVKNASSGNSWLDAGTTFTSDADASKQTPPKAGSSTITKVELNVTNAAFSIGSTSSDSRKKVTASITPSNAPDKQVRWELSGTHANKYELYDAATSGKLVKQDTATDVLTVYVAPAVSSLSSNHTATLTVETVDGNKSASCKILVTDAAISTKPTANVTSVAKTAATQKSINFTLTNSPVLKGSWRVFSGASGSTIASGIGCSNNGATLTLSHATNVPDGTYYVAITEDGRTESARLALTVSPYGTAYSIQGTIVGEDGNGLPAVLQLKNSSGQNYGTAVTANANGIYTISNVIAGTGYTISVSHSEYVTGNMTSFNVTGNITGKNLSLQKTRYSITGFVRGSDAPNGLEATLQLMSGTNKVGSSVKANSSGNYEITNVLKGTYTIDVTMTGYDQGTINNVVVASANLTGQNCLLTATSTPPPPPATYIISGKVTDTTGTAISGAEVSLGLDQGGPTVTQLTSTTTNTDGSYSISGLEADNYLILITKLNYANHEEQLTINGNVTKNFTLAP